MTMATLPPLSLALVSPLSIVALPAINNGNTFTNNDAAAPMTTIAVQSLLMVDTIKNGTTNKRHNKRARSCKNQLLFAIDAYLVPGTRYTAPTQPCHAKKTSSKKDKYLDTWYLVPRYIRCITWYQVPYLV